MYCVPILRQLSLLDVGYVVFTQADGNLDHIGGRHQWEEHESFPCESYTKNSDVWIKSHVSLLTWNHIETDFKVLSYNKDRELNLMYYWDHAPFSRAS